MMRTALSLAVGSVVRWTGLVSLAYHRIGDGRDARFDRGLWSADVDQFERQIQYVKLNYDVVGPGDVDYIRTARRGRHVMITFDDGYRDNYAAAFPILKHHRVSATFFVATSFIDTPSTPWWDEIAWMVRGSQRDRLVVPGFLNGEVVLDNPDRTSAIRSLLRSYAALPAHDTDAFIEAVAHATGTGRLGAREDGPEWMTWDMLREMRDAGMTIGGHSVRHQMLSRMSPSDQWEEITGCARRLDEELGSSMRYFAYPVGRPESFTADTRGCLKRAGVRFAFSYYGRYRRIDDWDDYDMRRIPVEQHMSLAEFCGRVLAPWH
jgi:peptidoglycan/xylan/chitin deacetylase (PgdA/CDA1 family)